MYKAFRVKNFRCFSDIAFESLERVNLITGKNNVGKTALLEALWVHQGFHNPQMGFRIDAMRGLTLIQAGRVLRNLFFRFDQGAKIQISSERHSGESRTLSITVQDPVSTTLPLRNGDEAPILSERLGQEVIHEFTDGSDVVGQSRALVTENKVEFKPSPIEAPIGIFLQADRQLDAPREAERLGNLEETGDEERIVQVLKIIEPRLVRLSVVYREQPMIFGDIGADRLMPLPLMGGGMFRLLTIALAIGNAPGGIVLLDEIENGLHHTVIGKVWKAIANLARHYEVQVFATTHSAETIRAAHETFVEEEQYDFRLHRLDRIEGVVTALSYDKETLAAALETELEVR